VPLRCFSAQRAACGARSLSALDRPTRCAALLGDSGESAASVATTEEGLTASPLALQMFCWDETSCNMRYATHDYYMSSIKKPWSYDFAQGGACPRYGCRASPARADVRVISILPPQASSPRTAAARGAPPTAYMSSAYSLRHRYHIALWRSHMLRDRYCSSDLWSGDVGASAATFGYEFRGSRIVAAVMQDLMQRHGLGSKDGTRLLFGGCSAGAIGAMNNRACPHVT
jgi:hypothetical protein